LTSDKAILFSWQGSLHPMTMHVFARIGAAVLVMTLGLAVGCLNRTTTPAVEETVMPEETDDLEGEDTPAGKPLKEVTPPLRAVIDGNNAFAVDLFRLLSKEQAGQNLFFSPYSVSSALAMVAEGARGQTAEEMGKVLHYPASVHRQGEDGQPQPWDMDRIHSALAALNDHFVSGRRPMPRAIRDKLAGLRKQLQQTNQEGAQLIQQQQWEKQQQIAQQAVRLVEEINQLQPQYNRYDLRIANALWGEKTYVFRQAYLDRLHRYYATGGLFALDFRHDPEGSRQRINEWVEKQTHNRIKDIIPQIDAAMVKLILTNAIYFKGEWSEVFSRQETREEDFHLTAGTKVRVYLMSQQMDGGRYAAFRGDGSLFDTPATVAQGADQAGEKLYPDTRGFQMLELPYKGEQMSMVVLVPRSASGLDALEQKLTAANLRTWIGQLEQRKAQVFLPRFKLEREYELEKALPALGMKRLFTNPLHANGAQLDGISESQDPSQKLYVTKVIHKAFVEVNEKGTEAAAATAVMMALGAKAEPRVPFIPVVRADRPFLFLIRDQKTNSILFLGRMLNPK
jgi:serine protease inhibitor